MAVGPAIEMWSATEADLQSPDGIQRSGTISKGYSVVTDPTDDVTDVYVAPNLPQLGDVYPGTVQMRVTQKPLIQQVSPIYYLIKVTWEGEFGPGGAGDDPINIPPKYRWRTEISDEPLWQWIDGTVILTPNAERVPNLTRKVYDRVMMVERNYAVGAFDLQQFDSYYNSVNSDAIALTNIGTWPPGTARVTKFDPDEEHDIAAAGYWKVNAEITFRSPYPNTVPTAETWWQPYVQEGFRYKLPSGEIVNGVDDHDDKLTRPVLLDDNGEKVTNPANAVIKRVQHVTPLSYAALGLF